MKRPSKFPQDDSLNEEKLEQTSLKWAKIESEKDF
jgi:hypothetical protein